MLACTEVQSTLYTTSQVGKQWNMRSRYLMTWKLLHSRSWLTALLEVGCNRPCTYIQQIGECREYFDFHSALPSEVKKVWQISKHPGPRITLQCNGVTVLDTLLSNSFCKKPNWGQYWSRPVKQIMFGSVDKTSDKYRAAAPGKNHHVQNHLFIITLHIIILSVLLLT